MRNTLLFLVAVAIAILCWGLYGPVLQWGQADMSTVAGQHAWLRPLVCVGLAYSLIGLVLPAVGLSVGVERGRWTPSGTAWSLAGGAAGVIGTLGVLLALAFSGRPIYVMPVAFGGAAVINALLTVVLAGRRRETGALFLAGVIVVVLGAVVVSTFAPASNAAPSTNHLFNWAWRLLALALAMVGWGAYGPMLYRGQADMDGSWFRPMLCVGLACLVMAVLIPSALLAAATEPSRFTVSGMTWSVIAGTAGAIGAAAVALSYYFGGRSVYVLPAVYGGAPVVNTFVAMSGQPGPVSPLFLAGLILVIAGSALVLVLAKHGEEQPAPLPSETDAPRAS